MKKLIVCLNDINFRKNYDVVWFNSFLQELYKNINLIYINPCEYNDSFFIQKYNKIPDYIIGYEIFFWPNNKSKKILITEDLHHRNLETYDKLFENIDIILPRFNIINNLFNNKFINKIHDFPLYCSYLFFTDNINFNSKNKIIIYGNLNCTNYNKNQYILRLKWYNYFKDNYDNLFNYIKKSSKDTSVIIREYTFGFVCGYTPVYFSEINEKKNGYVVAKFFEILGSGLLLLADTTDLKEELENYGFLDNVNYIDVTFENINEKIKFIMNPINKEKINQIRIKGYNLIKNNHLIKNRINTIKKILDI